MSSMPCHLIKQTWRKVTFKNVKKVNINTKDKLHTVQDNKMRTATSVFITKHQVNEAENGHPRGSEKETPQGVLAVVWRSYRTEV